MAAPLTTRSEWLAAHPPSAAQLTQTLVGVADRTLAGEDFAFAAREFLDEFALRGEAELDRSGIRPLP